MKSPLFELLKRNLAVPDVDIDDKRGRRRGLRSETIAAFQMAYRLHTKQGVARFTACKKGAESAGCGLASIYTNWDKYKARLREDGLL